MIQLSNQALPPAACTEGEEAKPARSRGGIEVLAGPLCHHPALTQQHTSHHSVFLCKILQRWGAKSHASHKDFQGTMFILPSFPPPEQQICGLKPFFFHPCWPQASTKDTASFLGLITTLKEARWKMQTHLQVSLLSPTPQPGSPRTVSQHYFPLEENKHLLF